MRCAVLCAAVLWTPASAAAEGPWSAQATLSTSFVSGPVNPAGTDARGTWNPSLRIALRPAVSRSFGEVTASAGWSVFRDQTLGCDTCDTGYAPRNAGGRIDSSDLSFALSRSWERGGSSGERPSGSVAGRVEVGIPASRDSLVCNPLYGAPGASVIATQRIAGRTNLAATGSAAVPLYRYDAAPVGSCAPGLAHYTATQTLSGAVAPQAWDGARFGASNPLLTLGSGLELRDPVGGERWHTALGAGVQTQRRRGHGEATVDALDGPVVVDAADKPFTTLFPLSARASLAPHERVDLGLSLSHALPWRLSDAGARLRSLPATTTVTASATGRW